MPVTTSSVYADPAADGSKAEWTGYGAATDWQAVNKGVRVGATPANTSGIRSSTNGQISRFNFTVPTIPGGLYINWVRVHAYFEAVPADHSVALGASSLVGSGHGLTVTAGQTGWRSSGKYSPFPSDPTILRTGDTVTAQFTLAEGAAQAANSDITAVYIEFGLSSMEHTVASGRNIVGALSGARQQYTFAGYASLAFDSWMAADDMAGPRAVVRSMVERGLDLCRVFIPFGDMMTDETTVNETQWQDFEDFLEVCREEGLRLIVTGLVTFVTDHRPAWLDALTEANRWSTFRRWWDRCARACSSSPCVVAYDVINEPFAQDGGTVWYLGGPPFDWGSYLCKDLSARTAANIFTSFMTSMRDVSSVGIGTYDKAKPRGAGIPITGSYGGGTLGMSWASSNENTILFPHLYLWNNAAGTPQANLTEFRTLQAQNKPIIVQESGRLDATYSDAQFIDFMHRLFDEGAVAVNGGWKNLFDDFTAPASFKHHMALAPLVKKKDIRAARVGRNRGGRVGARTV